MALVILSVSIPVLAWVFLPLAVGTAAIAAASMDALLEAHEDAEDLVEDYLECAGGTDSVKRACKKTLDQYNAAARFASRYMNDVATSVDALKSGKVDESALGTIAAAGALLTALQGANIAKLARLAAYERCVDNACSDD